MCVCHFFAFDVRMTKSFVLKYFSGRCVLAILAFGRPHSARSVSFGFAAPPTSLPLYVLDFVARSVVEGRAREDLTSQARLRAGAFRGRSNHY